MAQMQDYLNAAQPSLDRVKAFYKDRDLVVSDVVDVHGNQYVNLVQEGGGVLGVALVGYTYILEQMGIRFMKMAGTSAGAINTMVLACLGGKEEEKSIKVLELIAKKNFFDFVDGHPSAKYAIRNLITSKSFARNVTVALIILVIALIVSLLVFMFQLGRDTQDFWYWFGVAFFTATWTATIFMAFRFFYLYKRFLNADFGINPGKEFLDWVSAVLEDNGIKNLNDLRRHIEKVPEGGFLLRREEDPEGLRDLNKPKLENFLTLVTSDVTNQMKVEFPRHWPLYWSDPTKIKPGYFVRASMAVPLFFEPFVIENIPRKDVYPVWQAMIGLNDPYLLPTSARFVDGGMISNFPINVFYNPNVAVPRMPTFGIMLEAEVAPPRTDYNTLLSYAAAMFNTVRYNYDKEFLIKNADFNKTIGRIDVAKINWLNFNLSEDEKVDLFRRGAEAAAAFLLGEDRNKPSAAVVPEGSTGETPREVSSAPVGGFNWDEYKNYRKNRKHTMGF